MYDQDEAWIDAAFKKQTWSFSEHPGNCSLWLRGLSSGHWGTNEVWIQKGHDCKWQLVHGAVQLCTSGEWVSSSPSREETTAPELSHDYLGSQLGAWTPGLSLAHGLGVEMPSCAGPP